MKKRLQQAGVSTDDPDGRLLREVAIFADRSDITEELTRLTSHFKQARNLLHSRSPSGRSLDFLAQEMFREINTVGSKANDSRIVKSVVAFKSELERLFRDCRAGRFHPATSTLTHELIGKGVLGIDPDEQPRWG